MSILIDAEETAVLADGVEEVVIDAGTWAHVLIGNLTEEHIEEIQELVHDGYGLEADFTAVG